MKQTGCSLLQPESRLIFQFIPQLILAGYKINFLPITTLTLLVLFTESVTDSVLSLHVVLPALKYRMSKKCSISDKVRKENIPIFFLKGDTAQSRRWRGGLIIVPKGGSSSLKWMAHAQPSFASLNELAATKAQFLALFPLPTYYLHSCLSSGRGNDLEWLGGPMKCYISLFPNCGMLKATIINALQKV